MKRKSLFTILAIALMFVLSLSVLTACNKNKHEFSSEWKFDETNHWHECTTKQHTDTTEKTPHVFTWTEKTPAGFHTDKVEKGVCECGYETERTISDTATHTYGEEWKKDESGHWHDSTCDATAPTHDVIKGNFAAHTFDEEIVKEADYGVVGEKKFTCTVCEYSYTEEIDALGAKDNEIKLAEGKTLGKEYDGEVLAITKGDFVIDGNRVPTFMFKAKGADDNTYAATAPKKAGEYIVKVSVAATAEWKSATKTFDFAITPMVISVDWEPPYNNSNIFTGAPAELLLGDEATITVTMESANVGATVQSFEITGKDAGNYSLAAEDVNVAIVKADIDFEISNASALTEFFVGATNIPDPTTDYEEIGTGYGEKTVVWEMQVNVEDNVWGPVFAGSSKVRERAGNYRVRIQYAEGDNYNFGATKYVNFTVKAKSRSLTVKNFEGKTYDGKQVANFTFDNLVNKFGANLIDGVENFTSATDSGEKYVEFREVGGEWGRNLNVANVLTNAGEYEYRIGVTATDEWEAVVSEVKTFTIAQVEIKLEKGYITTSTILQNGDLLYLASHTPVAGETVALRLVNAKAGLELTAPGSGYVKQDQKKQVSLQNNLDCFKLTATTNTILSNYKIVKDPKQTSVEITVPPSEKGVSTPITGKSESIDTENNKKLSMWTTVNTGSFQVGQTVIVSDNTGTKLFEAKIVRVGVVDPNGDGTYNITSQSGCVIPSDGKVCIQVDTTGLTYDVNKVVGGTVRVK